MASARTSLRHPRIEHRLEVARPGAARLAHLLVDLAQPEIAFAVLGHAERGAEQVPPRLLEIALGEGPPAEADMDAMDGGLVQGHPGLLHRQVQREHHQVFLVRAIDGFQVVRDRRQGGAAAFGLIVRADGFAEPS